MCCTYCSKASQKLVTDYLFMSVGMCIFVFCGRFLLPFLFAPLAYSPLPV